MKFISVETTHLEIIESVDMNRFLENEISIYMKITNYDSDAVDDKSDLVRVVDKMNNDDLFKKYN